MLFLIVTITYTVFKRLIRTVISYVYLCEHMPHMCRCLRRSEEGAGSPGVKELQVV